MPKILLLEKISVEEMIDHMNDLYHFALTKLTKIDKKPKVSLKKDKKNAGDMFGKTGSYNPENSEIILYISERHPKDVLRSFAHELVHHEQNCSGFTATIDMSKTHEADYASKDPKLREAEREAFERGNMIFRDWCDGIKAEREEKNMNESQLRKTISQLVKEVLKEKELDEEELTRAEAEKEGIPFDKANFNKKGKSSDKLDDYEVARARAIRDASKGKDKKKPKSKKEEAMKAVKEAEAMGRSHAKTSLDQRTGQDLKRMKKEAAAETLEKLAESKQIGGIVELKPITDIQHPYPQLFQKKERALKDAFENKDQRIYDELMKRFGYNKKDE